MKIKVGFVVLPSIPNGISSTTITRNSTNTSSIGTSTTADLRNAKRRFFSVVNEWLPLTGKHIVCRTSNWLNDFDASESFLISHDSIVFKTLSSWLLSIVSFSRMTTVRRIFCFFFFIEEKRSSRSRRIHRRETLKRPDYGVMND